MRVIVDGAELHVELVGSGPPLLILAGSGSALADAPALASSPLAGAFSVAAYDHRGLGGSTAEDRPLTMADFAADGLAVADALGWSDFLLFGPSFGGMVALEIAVTAPGRVRRLGLACTSSGGAGGSSYPLHERPDPVTALGLIDTRPGSLAETAKLFAGRSAPAEPGYKRQLQARRGHDVWERLPLITAPTLVTAGRYDGIAPAANGEAIAARIPGARFASYEGGHAFLYQDPAAWPEVIDFLAG